MATSARRRLQSISRHLLPPPIVSQDLHPVISLSLSLNAFSDAMITLNSVQNPLRASDPISVHRSPVVIGGMVLDIHAKPCSDPVPGTTTPGQVQYISGGVARNIAECMSKLGSKPFIISVLGIDVAGDLMLKYWESAGLSTEGILKVQGITTPIVSNIFDSSGELAAAVASVEAVERFLTPEWIQQFRHNICSAQVLMVDANLQHHALEVASQIAAESGIPVWFEPVSVTKSKRIASIINYIMCTSPNENELIAMANALSPGGGFSSVEQANIKRKGQSVEQLFQVLKPAIHVLLEKGIGLLVVTLGSDGVFLCFKEGLDITKGFSKDTGSVFGRKLHELVTESCHSELFSSRMKHHYYAFHFPALHASVVSLTGAGDCLVGGIIASISAGLDMMQSTAVGIAAAKAAVESETNVPAEYSLRKLADEAKEVFFAAKQLMLD